MPNSEPVCGNCGQPVGATDITCPHCDALLAAYASPAGSTTVYAYDPHASLADALVSADMSAPPPAAPIVIDDSVATVSSAPRPLFDTQLTVEDIARAAESEHDEPMVMVKDDAESAVSAFAVPDYARPPADAAPVPLLEDVEAGMIVPTVAPQSRPIPASANRAPTPAPKPGRNNAASPPPEERGESWLYDLSRNAPTPQAARPVRERNNRPEPVRTTTLPPSTDRERGRTENYLRKLHDQSGYDGDATQLSQPIDTRTAWSPTRTQGTDANATLEKSRKGCSTLLIAVLFFMWLGVVGGIVTGDLNPGLLMFTVALTFLARFLGKPFPIARKK